MTTSAVRILNSGIWHHPGRRRGLTLLETILAMVVILVVISVGVAYQFNSQDKELLRKASVKIEAMSSRGHAMSVLHQKPFWLRVEHDKVVLAGADVRSQDLVDPDALPELTEDGEFSESNEEIYDTLEAGEAVIEIRRWGTQDDAWIRPEEGESVVWQFQSTGLCEPISIRVAKAESYIIMHMNPLTARVDEEESVIMQ
ncbi:MAG: type II secretion system GspH family protein [Roseibacillus sp.]|jgi:type II secretory pathway pseudopilin PulG|nr:type II secretion system GspH family protein [Roseibacillus sp.]